MGKLTPIFAREMAVRLLNQNYSQVEISKNTGIPRSTVGNIISKYKRDGLVRPSVSSGRPPKISIYSIFSLRLLGRLSNACPFLTSKRLKNEWSQGHKISTRTVRRYLQNMGLKGRVAAKKPILSKANKTARFEWCKNHQNITQFKSRKKGVSQTKLRSINLKKRSSLFFDQAEALNATNEICGKISKKSQQKIMIWRCVWESGHRQLARVQGFMDSTQY